MASDRVVKLFIVVVVLAAAWCAGRKAARGMAIPVAIVGLTAASSRAVLGMPVAIAMVALAVYLPGVAIATAVVVALLTLISLWVKAALRHGTVLGRSMTPGDGLSLGFGFDGRGWLDGGGADGDCGDGGV